MKGEYQHPYYNSKKGEKRNTRKMFGVVDRKQWIQQIRKSRYEDNEGCPKSEDDASGNNKQII
jgi:hypothetical protein